MAAVTPPRVRASRNRKAPRQRPAQATYQNRLIEQNLGLVRHVIGKLVSHLPAGADVENLISAGTLGLVEAARKFDPARGIKFETYSFTRIRGAVLDELRRNCPLPQHVLDQVTRVRKAYAEIEGKDLEPEAALEQVAWITGFSADQVADCLTALRMTRVRSLDREWAAGDYQIADRADSPPVHVEKEERKQLLAQAIEALPDRERLVVTLYYMEELRLRDIGAVLHLSESRVSRVLSAALFTVGEFIRKREGAAGK